MVAFLLIVESAFALTGRQIMDRSDKLKEPQTSKTRMLMVIYKGDRKYKKVFKSISKKVNGKRRTLISFIKPTRLKFLTHARGGGDDDQWLRLTSGRIKRIAGSDKDSPFVNSHFLYEDMQSRNIDDYNYKLLGETTVLGHECYIVESRKKTKSRVYNKIKVYVRKSDYFVVKVIFYKKNRKYKILENYRITVVKGIITPKKVVMRMVKTSGKTILYTKELIYNGYVSTAKLSRGALR